MFRLSQAKLNIAPLEKRCVRLAAWDLLSDITRVTGKTIPCAEDGNLIIRTVKTGEWEAYTIHCDEEKLIIEGSDERGTMFGIYELCQRFLGVDPLYLFTDHEPEKQTDIEIGRVDIHDKPHTYQFRGWFINDEDLIEGFSRQGRPEKGYDFLRDYQPFLSMLCETALRMKQNLIIPCSHLDILKPEHEEIIKVITERGLFVSMHHQQPVGVHQFTVDEYFSNLGIENINFMDNTDLYREIWTTYIQKWAKYDNVIWQLGLRGRGDRPVWYANSSIPSTTQARGKLISDAIQMQYDIAKQAYSGHEFYSTSTLWMEGMGLYKENALSFPGSTIIVQADFAPNQMWGEGYYDTPRSEGTKYGVYYHVGFWGCGPHLVQGNDPIKIYHNYRAAVEKGDNAYSVLNVANFREHVMGIKCVADITWDIDRFDLEAFLPDFCRKEYKDASIASLYQEYFDAFFEMDHTHLPGEMRLMDGMCRRVGLKLIELIQGQVYTKPDIQNSSLFDFESAEDFISYYEDATSLGIARFEKLQSKLKPINNFYTANLVVQVETILALYRWVNGLARRNVSYALEALKELMEERKSALYGKWEHWYDGDTLINLPKLIEDTMKIKDYQSMDGHTAASLPRAGA